MTHHVVFVLVQCIASDPLQITVLKKNGKNSGEESFLILSEGITVFSSPVFIDDELMVLNVELPQNEHLEYELILQDK